VSPSLANFLFEAANFLLLAAALGWLLFKPVRRALDAERERHDREAEEERRLRGEAEAMAREAALAREAASREAVRRREEILAAANREAAQLLEEARRARSAERRALERELELAREAQAAALAGDLGRIAGESVARLLERLEGPPLDAALVRAACEELRALPPSVRRSALVEVARPLDEQARGLLKAALGGDFQERRVGELGAGVRVITSAGQVDATAASIARLASRAVAAAAAGVAPEEKGGPDG
jgi:F0F1-type ATP synthase membrane subunit b/b'